MVLASFSLLYLIVLVHSHHAICSKQSQITQVCAPCPTLNSIEASEQVAGEEIQAKNRFIQELVETPPELQKEGQLYYNIMILLFCVHCMCGRWKLLK